MPAAAPACDGTMPSACDGTTWVGCADGVVQRFDCQPTETSCVVDPGAWDAGNPAERATCEYAAQQCYGQATVGEPSADCVGTSLTFCANGRIRTYDCTAFGVARCAPRSPDGGHVEARCVR